MSETGTPGFYPTYSDEDRAVLDELAKEAAEHSHEDGFSYTPFIKRAMDGLSSTRTESAVKAQLRQRVRKIRNPPEARRARQRRQWEEYQQHRAKVEVAGQALHQVIKSIAIMDHAGGESDLGLETVARLFAGAEFDAEFFGDEGAALLNSTRDKLAGWSSVAGTGTEAEVVLRKECLQQLTLIEEHVVLPTLIGSFHKPNQFLEYYHFSDRYY